MISVQITDRAVPREGGVTPIRDYRPTIERPEAGPML
jgi:hypothetical protein